MSAENKWQKTKEALGSITVRLLENLLDSVDSVGSYNISRYSAYKTIGQSGFTTDGKYVSSRLNDLKRRGYIKIIDNDNNNKSIILTNKAKMKIVDKIASKIKKDEMYRFVSFDIPEDIKNNRDLFRMAIKRMGFMRIQQSLWVINKDVSDLVEAAAYEYGVEKYVVYLVSAKSDIDGILSKKFSR